jgi:hypothetical protein
VPRQVPGLRWRFGGPVSVRPAVAGGFLPVAVSVPVPLLPVSAERGVEVRIAYDGMKMKL